jgi:putative endonuclease
VDASVKPQPELKKRALSIKQLRQSRNHLGAWGEQRAADYLQQLGYRILDRNIAYKQLEADIVAFDQSSHELVFVEVKTRVSTKYGPASDAFGWRKLLALQRLAIHYVRLKRLSWDYRFDLISIESAKIRHYQNVSWG